MTEVIVAGDDVVALATALGLARAGVDVVHIRTEEPPDRIGASVVPWPALPLLDQLGVLEELLGSGGASHERQLRVVRTGELVSLDLGALAGAVTHPYDLRCDDRDLRGVLESHLSLESSVRAVVTTGITGVAQDEDEVVVDLDQRGEVVCERGEWLVAADGTSSTARRLTGIGFPGFTWQERGIVALVGHDFNRLGYASTTLQIDDEVGALVQQASRGWRLVCAEPLGLDAQTVSDRLAESLARVHPGSTGSVTAWRATRMHERTATAYRAGRVLLAGDAAHATNDFSGDGIVTGLMDSCALVQALPAVVRREAQESVLDAYAESRRRDFVDRVLPASLDRKNLITQITDPRKLDTELDQYRRAVEDPETLRELLLFGNRPLDDASGF